MNRQRHTVDGVARRSVPFRLVCLAVAVAVLMPTLFILTESHHDCTGDGCPICHELTRCVQATDELGTGTIETHVVLAMPLPLLLTLQPVLRSDAPCKSLVGLKVRLDI
ncbi:MAG: hypothetical protein LKI25_02295 [Atopobiaceae bacterium]|jgi:hypothetical protein|nr:hypothetical protein [Atopobiaceae bacterium]MCI2173037.1 hypothetical protein [Atopobiaceae bacterium]MCI2208130.1 hypothetical protein [Atopobiaceae bacterium]